MNKIVNYVNNLFYALPKSEENARLKSQILDSLQSKYQRYLEEGMSEDMAFGLQPFLALFSLSALVWC